MAEPDLTDQFNTRLSDDDERRFGQWVAQQSVNTKRNIANDLYDYDLKGWWQHNQTADLSDAHLPDTYKKPNHPTFSSESKYSGKDGLVGGKWEKGEGNTWAFVPSKTNLQMHGPRRLKQYFDRVEPGNTLVLPGMDTIATGNY